MKSLCDDCAHCHLDACRFLFRQRVRQVKEEHEFGVKFLPAGVAECRDYAKAVS